MNEQTWAVVDLATSKVVNVIVWDGETAYDPGEGLELVSLEGIAGGIGWDYNPKATKHKFIDNRPQEDPLGPA